jgi:L-fuculose-phosphate aldolase
VGKDLFNAYYKMETLEHFAHIAFVAQQLGHMNVLNKDQVQKLTDLRTKFGVRTEVGCVSCEDEGTCQIPSPAPETLDRDALVREITDAILRRMKPGS